VLIVRVYRKILRSAGLPDTSPDDTTVGHEHERSIVDLEKQLHLNRTSSIKFFLQFSKQELCKRFAARIEEPEKNGTFSLADGVRRKFWKHYMKAYSECL
jgi:polyphosphate kinase 2 (PPK2 family)